MTDAIRNAKPAAKPAAQRPLAPAANKAPAGNAPAFESDSFMSRKPTAQELAGFRAAVAGIDNLPAVPMGREAKKAWVAANKPKIEAAKAGLDKLEDAAFWHKNVPQAEIDAAREKLYRLEDKLQGIEEAAGTKPPTEPASPFRPLMQLSDGCRDMMGRNPLLAIVGILCYIPALLVDGIDAVTRPLQALAYPFFKVRHEIREAQYEKEHPKTK